MQIIKEKKTMRTALYARCSTHDKGQDPEMQLQPLREYCAARGWSIVGEFIDIGQSGAKDRRPQLDEFMDAAKKRQIDSLVVWKLDRFGRSLKHLVIALDELSSLGVAFISYREYIDLSTPTGKLMFHMIAAMAEFEREMIGERVRAGLVNARRKGKKLGRKPVPQMDKDKIIALLEKDSSMSVRKIARKLGMSSGFVGGVLKEYRMNKDSGEL